MLNTKRVHQMSKIALYEKKEAKALLVNKKSEKDYVAFWTIACALGGSLAYFTIAFVVIVCLATVIDVKIPIIAIIFIIIGLLLGYVFHMFFYLRIARAKARNDYRDGLKKQEELTKQYQVLDEMYEEENKDI